MKIIVSLSRLVSRPSDSGKWLIGIGQTCSTSPPGALQTRLDSTRLDSGEVELSFLLFLPSPPFFLFLFWKVLAHRWGLNIVQT